MPRATYMPEKGSHQNSNYLFTGLSVDGTWQYQHLPLFYTLFFCSSPQTVNIYHVISSWWTVGGAQEISLYPINFQLIYMRFAKLIADPETAP